MKIKKISGYLLLIISSFLTLDWILAISFFAFAEYGLWGGIFNFALFPITFFLKALLRLFFGGAWDELISVASATGLFYLAWSEVV